ncbi:hypothetical protein PI93_013910 [Pandoraea fibrosis]|uniref:Transmembrane protein n=1 Tax=Pandoraea fibrosis TaxID=1891094 RepID=A0ABX6HRS0_9BURK|nr:hypothetical protein [Pandoraea fibrosis]QHE92826.1 hypothetical protein PJ20_014090 [Pandoraea fibrosis]QHF13617.1 hypothetical protein PI93_013910 [Pandoraea fibrosis]
MRWAAELTLLFGGIMLWGHLGVTYARPVPHFSTQSHGVSQSGQQRAVPAPSPRNPSKNAPSQADGAADRRNDDLPNTPPGRRPNGHMSAEDRRLLRQHIQDAVRELYSH